MADQMAERKIEAALPKAFCGFFVQRLDDGRWLFGIAKGRIVHWEFIELSDLLDLGVDIEDVESVVPERAYRVAPTGVTLHALDGAGLAA